MSHHPRGRHHQPDGPVSRQFAATGPSTPPEPNLFNLPPESPRQVPPPPTSHLAGAAAAKLAPTRRDQILALLTVAGPGGLTLYEMAAALEVSVHTISGRLTELVRAQRICTTGHRRKNAFGNDCEIYALAPAIFRHNL